MERKVAYALRSEDEEELVVRIGPFCDEKEPAKYKKIPLPTTKKKAM